MKIYEQGLRFWPFWHLSKLEALKLQDHATSGRNWSPWAPTERAGCPIPATCVAILESVSYFENCREYGRDWLICSKIHILARQIRLLQMLWRLNFFVVMLMPRSRECGTYETVKDRIWPLLPPVQPEKRFFLLNLNDS